VRSAGAQALGAKGERKHTSGGSAGAPFGSAEAMSTEAMTVTRRLASRTGLCTGIAVLAFVAALAAMGTPALAAAPFWHVTTEAVPTNLPPGGEAQLVVSLSNLGDAPVEGAKSPVTITDALPSGLKALAISGQLKNGGELKCSTAEPPTTPLTCTFNGILFSYELISVTVTVKVEEPAGTTTHLSNAVTVEGGGAASLQSTQALRVSGEPTQFGVQHYELSPLNDTGTPATAGGAQPFQLTTTLVTNQNASRQSVALPKDLSFTLPPGMVGNPTAVAQCNEADFAALVLETNLCPPDSAVGVATVVAYEPLAGIVVKTVPVFNLVPAKGEPARFGLEVIGKIPIVIDTAVRAGRDYEVIATVHNTTQVASLLSSQVTLWGDPGDPRHNDSRGWECVAGGAFAKEVGRACPVTSAESETPFLRTPTSCESDPAAEPVTSTVSADSWADPATPVEDTYTWTTGTLEPLGFQNCAQLPFTPQVAVAPEVHTAATPTGLMVDVKVPQQALLEPEKLAQADVRDSKVTLPAGVELNPAAANGLEACPERAEGGHEGIGFEGFQKFSGAEAQPETATFTPTFRFTREEVEGRTLPPSCPEASKVGVVHIKTPLLPHELEGSVYLASPAPNGEPGKNPFDSLVALYIVAEDDEAGVLVKLAGKGELNEGSLRVGTSFSGAPQVPFEELQLELFGGPKASLSTPAFCGDYATEAVFTPWSGNGAVNPTTPGEEFAISSGAGGGACPAGSLPFNPEFLAQSVSAQAGAFTGFDLELVRPDGDQALSTVSMHLPQGDAALLSAVELCGEAQAAASACPEGSLVGEATAVAGLGQEPYVQRGGRVYITGPYGGAPFGLEIVTPADAGPFNLGYVTVRSRLYISPENASVTIVSDPLPTQLKGIPLQLKRVLVDVNRPDFEFNPTNCSPMEIDGTITGSEGASAAVSSPYRVENCARLPFAPALSASVTGHASKADGTTFRVKVTSKGLGQANIAKVDLQLPKQLPSRLPTIQKACLASVFEANPATCDEGSLIGTATIHTPVLKNALSGPAYLVSHGNAAFPDVEFVLQGEGIKLVLDGKTQIKNGITYSKFESAPDAPFTTFETVLPAGPHSALTANVAERKHFELCGETLQMPTTITGQNGTVIERDTKITIQGCAAVKAAKAKKLTNAQELAKALAACRKRYTHANNKRVACERLARHHYPPAKTAPKHMRVVDPRVLLSALVGKPDPGPFAQTCPETCPELRAARTGLPPR
jgi:hypothetical protein